MFNVFDEEIDLGSDSNKNKAQENIVEKEDENSFEIHIEENHFNDDLLGFGEPNNKSSQQPDPVAQSLPAMTDANTGSSTEDSRVKYEKANEKEMDYDMIFSPSYSSYQNADTVDLSMLYKQDNSDVWLNCLETEDQFTAFIGYLEKLKQRIEQSKEKDSQGSSIGANSSSNNESKIIDNYVEISDLKEKLTGNQ